jgi:quinol monooxygenase YgiN
MQPNHYPYLVVFTMLFACTSDETESQPQPEPQKEDFSHLFDCQSEGLDVARPLSGPGFDPAQGGLTGTMQENYVVHTTQIFVRPEQQQRFFQLVGQVVQQLAETPGLIGYSLASDPKCGDARTMGVWANEDAIYAFVGPGAHAEAMPQAVDLGFTGRTMHWSATAAEVNALDWETVDAKLRESDPDPIYD